QLLALAFRDVVVVDDARGRWRHFEAAFEFFIAELVARRFAGVMIEPQADARLIRQVRQDIVRGDEDLAVLHVFRMAEFDVVDLRHFAKQYGTDAAVKVRLWYQAQKHSSQDRKSTRLNSSHT